LIQLSIDALIRVCTSNGKVSLQLIHGGKLIIHGSELSLET